MTKHIKHMCVCVCVCVWERESYLYMLAKLLKFLKNVYYLALSIFHNVCLCITVQSHVSGLDIRTARSTRRAKKTLGIVGVTVERCVRSFPRTHLKCTHTDRRVNSVRILNWALLHFFCAWMNKYRQNYIQMHVLANILVNIWLSIAYVLM